MQWRVHSVAPRRRILLASLMLSLAVIAIASGACNVTISATTTPTSTSGTTVFGALIWGPPNQKINIVFVPGTGYGAQNVVANRQVFLNDVANVISNGFYQNNAIVSNITKFNFWFMVPATNGSVTPPSSGICPVVTWPNLADAAFAESVIMLHTNPLRDCGGGGRASVQSNLPVVAVHEFSHAVWGIPDEYCCDGGYWSSPPDMYATQAACNADAANAGWRNCQSFTSVGGTTWWRSEDGNADLMVSVSAGIQYGPGEWVNIKRRLMSLPSAGTINDPSVFAPTTWNWP